MLLARKAKKSWHRTYMPGKAGLLLPWLPQKSGQGRAFQGWVAKVAIKARLWPGLTGFSRPYFSGKPGQKPGKPGLAGLCQACRAFGRTPDARGLLNPVTLQMVTRECINIFMAAQPCNTAKGYWGLHQYLHGYSALSNCNWELGIASISSWLLSPVTLQMGTGVYIKCFFMATPPCHTVNGNWRVHQYLHGYSALSHCKWVLGIA